MSRARSHPLNRQLRRCGQTREPLARDSTDTGNCLLLVTGWGNEHGWIHRSILEESLARAIFAFEPLTVPVASSEPEAHEVTKFGIMIQLAFFSLLRSERRFTAFYLDDRLDI